MTLPITNQEVIIAELQKQNRELVEALKPFADCAEVWSGESPSTVLHYSRRNVDGKPDLFITVCDLLIARAAIKKVEP